MSATSYLHAAFRCKIYHRIFFYRADYNLPNKTKTDLYIRIFNDNRLAKDVKMYSDFLMTSAYANKVEVVENDKDIPEGCAIVTGMFCIFICLEITFMSCSCLQLLEKLVHM